MFQMLFPYLIPLGFFAVFFVVYRLNPTKLLAGFLFTCFLLSFMGTVFLQAYHSDSAAVKVLLAAALLLCALLLSFGAYLLVAFLVYNTYAVLRREKRGLKHILTLIFAIMLLVAAWLPHILDENALPILVISLIYSVYGLFFYYVIHMTQYITTMVLCNFAKPSLDQDYLVVLGSWVQDGKVTPLLARRVDKAIAFWRKQGAKGKPPKLILSGGKGTDEICSEAEAMRDYAVAQGMSETDLLLETRSVSTLENMRFSKEIMERESGGKAYRCAYVTNNYHLLRAGIYAHKAGLRGKGLGAKTAFYYLPNAILREYIAYLYLHLKWHVVFAFVGLLFGCLVLPFLMKHIL